VEECLISLLGTRDLTLSSSTALVDLGRFFSFLIYTQSVRFFGRGISPSQDKQNKCTQTYMPRVRFEPTIPVFERAKAVHTLYRAATVIGQYQKWADIIVPEDNSKK
jgi:hypothetical protein